jgi:surface protein
VLFIGVLGAITLFTNTSFTGGQTLASAANCELSYNPSTKTLTVGPGDWPIYYKFYDNVSSAETIVFVSAGTSESKVVAPQDSGALFAWLVHLKQFQGMQNFDTSKVTNMYNMFAGCTSLAQLDLSGFDTSEVTSMSLMFQNCTSLAQLDLSGFDTSEVQYMQHMFDGCTALTQLDLSGFNTTKVTNMYHMFWETTALWKLTLGQDFVFTVDDTGLLDPVVGTKFNQNFVVNSTKWLQTTTDQEYTAAEIPTAHVKGQTDTFIWQGQGDQSTPVEYVVQPTYTITIPAAITIPSATEAGTGSIILSAYPKLPYENRFIHISAISRSTTPWHLTTTGDETGTEYDFSAEGGVNLKNGSNLILEADGEAPAKTKTVSASLTSNTHKFKYAGTYQDIVTFTIETATS